MKTFQEDLTFDGFKFTRYSQSGLLGPENKQVKLLYTNYLIMFIISGSYNITHDGEEYTFNAGDLIYFPKNTFFTVNSFNEDKLKFYAFKFPTAAIPSNIEKEKYSNILVFKHNQDLIDELKEIYISAMFKDEESLKKIGANSFKKVLQTMIDNINQGQNQQVNTNESLKKMCLFLKQDPKIKVTMDDLIKYSGFSKAYICSMFKKAFNVSPIFFRQIYVAALAKEQINRFDAKPQSIYQDFGFSNYATFYRQQIAVFGIPPHEKFFYPKINPFIVNNNKEFVKKVINLESEDSDREIIN